MIHITSGDDNNFSGFQMLSKEAQKRLSSYEHTVICLMILLAITSIIWSISLYILSGDFGYSIVGAKISFDRRDFQKLDEQAREILYKDLGNIINETYTEAALEAANRNSNEFFKEIENEESQITQKPKVRKIPHLFHASSIFDAPDIDEDEKDDFNATTVAPVPKVKFDIEADRKFIATMVALPLKLYQDSATSQFLYSFPFLSEMAAIIWTAMCLIYQSTVKKYWGLPKPWRIVLPSITIFSIMSLGSISYTIIANRHLKALCNGLREYLSKPDAISCGQAISVLRPIIRNHEFSHEVYVNLFRYCYQLSLLLWILALLVMLMRYIFAIDFQLVDVPLGYECTSAADKSREPEFVEVLLSKPTHQTATQHLQVNDRHKSEDDFQSAKSHLSEMASPLLHQA